MGFPICKSRDRRPTAEIQNNETFDVYGGNFRETDVALTKHIKVYEPVVGHMPLIPACRRQGQVDLCEFQANLSCKVSSRTVRATY